MRMFILLFSFLVISSVNALSVPDTTTTNYYVSVNGLDDSNLKSILESATGWSDYTPEITGVENGNIYFKSEKDLFRFLMPMSYSNPNSVLFSPNNIVVYDGDRNFGILNMVAAYESHGNNLHNSGNGYNIRINSSGDLIFVFMKGWGHTGVSTGGLNTNYQFNYVSGSRTLSMSSNYYGGSASFVCFYSNKTNVSLQPFDSEVHRSYTCEYLFNLLPLVVYTEPGAQIYVDETCVGTTDNGGYFKTQVVGGEYELKISKDGFWDYTKTITIQNDTTLHIDLVPKTSIIGLGYNLTERTYPDSIGTMDIHLTPIVDAYGTTLKLSGADIVSVCYNGNNLEAVNGKYILGDLSKGVQTELLIKFKTPSSFGKKSFTANIEATDVEGNAYSQNEIIEYNVEELPFLVELPAWKLGDNTVRITDTSGTSYGVSLVLYDKDGNEVWSDSQSMLEYGECDFTISITSPGDYVLEISGAGAKTYKEIHLIEPISIITKTISAGKGEVATVKFSITNPSNSVKYYYATLDCELMNLSANKTLKQFAVSPNENKTVEISFKVPSDAQYDSYSLNLNVYDSDTKELLYSNMVVLDIVESSLIPVGNGDSTVLILAAVVGVLLIAGIGMYFVRK